MTLTEAVQTLRAAGLYVNDRDANDDEGHTPLIRGGTHTEGSDIKVIQGFFCIALKPENAVVAYPARGNQTEDRSFPSLKEAVAYVTSNWSPPPDARCPYDRKTR